MLCLISQSCPTLCDPVDCSPSGSSVHGDSRGKDPSGWSGLLECCWSGWDLPNPEIEPRSLTLHVDSLPSEPQEKPRVPKSYKHSQVKL